MGTKRDHCKLIRQNVTHAGEIKYRHIHFFELFLLGKLKLIGAPPT